MSPPLLPPLVAATFLLAVSNVVLSQSLIKSLPGFSGDLPFKLETGYIGVGESEKVQLFYYFVESERSPEDDPLIIWLAGGPGCSGFATLAYQFGPLSFNTKTSTWNSPTLSLDPFSWTKVANVIFLDAPVGAGFSYATTWDGYVNRETASTAQNYEFLRKWLKAHPKFLPNPLYIAGESYSGQTVQILVQEISNGKDVGDEPSMNLKGFLLGNPFTDEKKNMNSRIVFAHRMALLSDGLYQSAKRNCKGEYFRPDPSNKLCMEDLQAISLCLESISMCNILEPKCTTFAWNQRFQGEGSIDAIRSIPLPFGPSCREYNYPLSHTWANDKTVQRALHVREGSITEWQRCNVSLSSSFVFDMSAGPELQRNFIKKGYRGLIYSGDHDMLLPYVGTQAWINSLNLSVSDKWRPWFVDRQIAGYTIRYSKNKYSLTFATVKGAGHTPPEYKPKECFSMIDRWLANHEI